MSIEKLEEFARDGQKNTDELILTDGFPRPKFPARQWFNYLFNMLSLKINEIIELDPISKAEIVDNLTTNDANKVASAGTVKELQDNKLDKTDLKDASTEQKGVVKLNNTLTSTSMSEALTAAQGKELSDNKLNSVSGVATGLKLANSAIREVTGSNYTITYNDSNRIAIIRMRVFTNKTVDGSGVFTVDEYGGYYKALITLPITLQKRISADFLLAVTSGGVSWVNEAGEWHVQCDPIGTNGVTESKVGVHLTGWRGVFGNEEIDGYLEVVGIF